MIDELNFSDSEILVRIGEHLVLVLVSLTIAIAVGIPLGILSSRYPQLAKLSLGLANMVQTLPSLAIFGFLITVPVLGGIGKVPAIFALSLYGLLPIIRNTYTGLKQIDPGLKEAALSLGLTSWQILIDIEIPLVLGMILAGVRVSAVICVGLATIAAAIGGGGLGVFIFRGLASVDNTIILQGAIPSAIIALLADWGLGWVEKCLTQRQPPPVTSRIRWRKRASLALIGLILFSLLGIYFQHTRPGNQSVGTIILGSKNFTEQVILGEILAQSIEAKTQLKVERKFSLGGTFICHEAVKSGQIDGYIEYTGTAFTAILKQKPLQNPSEVYQRVKETYAKEFDLEVFPSLGFNNTYAITIREEDAQKYNLKTISEVAKYAPKWRAGFGYEFLSREDGYPGLAKTYGLKFAGTPQAMELGLMYQALAQKKVDLVAGNSTDGLISVLKLFILEDDKHYFPPYEAVPIFNQKTLEKFPQIKPIIREMAGKISAEEMQKLNYQVDSHSQSLETVVKAFLQSKG